MPTQSQHIPDASTIVFVGISVALFEPFFLTPYFLYLQYKRNGVGRNDTITNEHNPNQRLR